MNRITFVSSRAHNIETADRVCERTGHAQRAFSFVRSSVVVYDSVVLKTHTVNQMYR
jgi:predicted transcriptional regulator